MSTTFTFASIADRFPVGSIVQAYPITSRPISNPDAPPSGAAVTSSSVAFDSSLTFQGLAEGAHYYAYALVNGNPTYTGFSTDPPAGTVVAGGTTGPPGPDGPPGPPGPPGPGGQDAVAISDAVRGETDRFNRLVGAVVKFDGSSFVAENDSFSRPQNIESVVTDSHKITIVHEDILPRALIDSDATAGQNLKLVGIEASARTATDLKSTDILLRQNRSLNDALTNPGDGSAWVKERGLASPFTAVGLTNVSTDFATYTQGLANVAGAWRLSEASGATLDDAIGANDGAVVGSGTTYGVTGGLPTDGSDKALTTTGISTNELTFPMAGITQAAFSLALRVKLPSNATFVYRDGTSANGTGYLLQSDGATPIAHIQYRMGDTGSTYTTTTAWSALADNQWHTLTVTKSGATVALYLDGVQIHTATNAGSTALAGSWHVGRLGTVATYGVVTLSEVVSYSRALTVDEARNVHETATTTGLLRITHTNVGSTKASEITLTPLGPLQPELVRSSVTATGFNIKFRDAAGVYTLTADSDLGVGISRDVRDVEVNPTAISVPVFVEKADDWDVAIPASGAVLWARLGESSGTSFNDEIGANDGTLQATVTLGAAGIIAGDADTAVTLDGAQGKIAFANPGLTGPFSIGLWFKQTGVGSVGNTIYGTLIGWGNARRIMVLNSSGLVSVEAGGATLVTAAGAAQSGSWHFFVYTWDGTTQKVHIDGLLAASNVSANVAFNAPFWLGSYLATSIAYSFKGSMDELALWNRALTLPEIQQFYVDGAGTVLSVDRSLNAQVKFHAFFETFAPPPPQPPVQEAPVATPLPAGDIGGAVAANISLAPYRAAIMNNGPSSSWCGRALPALQVDRDAIELNGLPSFPNATSDNWRIWFCHTYGIDPITGASVTINPETGGALQGGTTALFIAVNKLWVYVITDDDQPRRHITDLDVTVPGWPASFHAAEAVLGDLPVPADAIPDFTPDRYCFVYQPSRDEWAIIYAMQPGAAERATTQIELTASPSGGGFFLEFDYEDNVNKNIQTFYSQTPVVYNMTAPQMQSLLQASKTTAGALLGTLRGGANPIICSGGPLNVAPILCTWTVGAPLQPVGMRFTNNFLNAGSVLFTYKNADAWGSSRLSSITSPLLSGGHQPSLGTATATGIDQFPLIIDWNEYKAAYDIGIASGWDAPGTDLGHVLGMAIGEAGTGFVYPAARGDGTRSNSDRSRMVEGALITFPVDADSSKVAPHVMPLFNTIKRYGVMVYDKTGGGCEIVGRPWGWPGQTVPFPGPAPYLLPSVNQIAYMRQLPWHQMQIIDPADVQAGW